MVYLFLFSMMSSIVEVRVYRAYSIPLIFLRFLDEIKKNSLKYINLSNKNWKIGIFYHILKKVLTPNISSEGRLSFKPL